MLCTIPHCVGFVDDVLNRQEHLLGKWLWVNRQVRKHGHFLDQLIEPGIDFSGHLGLHGYLSTKSYCDSTAATTTTTTTTMTPTTTTTTPTTTPTTPATTTTTTTTTTSRLTTTPRLCVIGALYFISPSEPTTPTTPNATTTTTTLSSCCQAAEVVLTLTLALNP